MGCGGVLMLPPFYYKGVSDEGLFRNFSEIIERVGDERLRLYLYHIPPVSNVAHHAGADRAAARALSRHRRRREGFLGRLEEHQGDARPASRTRGFDVFPGSEVFLLDGLRAGGKGCITATGNVNPGPDQRGLQELAPADADELQAGITATRKIMQKVPMIPALKAVTAHFGNDPAVEHRAPAAHRAHARAGKAGHHRAEGRRLLDAGPVKCSDCLWQPWRCSR